MTKQKQPKRTEQLPKGNAWVDHVKNLCRSKNINYKTALQKGRRAYHKQKKAEAKSNLPKKLDKHDIPISK
jgi:hypothetical protein